MRKPYSRRDEYNGGEEVRSLLFEAGGDGSELFEFAEEAFDEVAPAIEFAISLRLYCWLSKDRPMQPSRRRATTRSGEKDYRATCALLDTCRAIPSCVDRPHFAMSSGEPTA